LPSGVTDILFERRGAAGIVTLNRPEALNALTHAMVCALSQQLEDWEVDGTISRVIVTAAGERAFCAGGDLRALYDLIQVGRHEEALQFWRDEYRLNAVIKRYRKPYVCLINGIAMGGGVGISIHGSHRVAGDGYRLAMPEVGIGFFPDVGATWFLPRLPGEIGTYLALTGQQVEAADAVTLGLATYRVVSSRLADLTDGLCGSVPVDAILAAFAEAAGPGPLLQQRPVIDRLFKADRVEHVLAALDEEASGEGEAAAFVAAAAAAIRTKAPLCVKLALAQMRHGKTLDFEACLRTEFRIVSRVVTGHDFSEGIRAMIVDKDHRPRWQPPSLDAVSDAEVARHFAAVASECELP
jgi:enoyl-CoA hydratase